MIEQRGRVLAVDDDRVLVRIGAGTGCAVCAEGRGCAAGVFARLLRRRPVVLAFENRIEARRGQAVMVGLPEAWFLALAARFYLYPVVAGLVGAVFGHYLSVRFKFGTAAGDAMTLLAGLLAASLPVLRNGRWSAAVPGAMPIQLLRVLDDDDLHDEKR